MSTLNGLTQGRLSKAVKPRFWNLTGTDTMRHVESPKAIDHMLTYSDADAYGSEIRFLPIRMDGSVGVYPEQAVDIFKELKGQGIDASWSISKEHRGWYGERTGIVEAVVIPLVLGVASSAAWDAFKLVLQKRRKSNFKIRILVRTDIDGSQKRLIDIDGNGTDLAEALEKLDPWRELKHGKELEGGEGIAE
nr:hypothetical protein [uncultured Actinoplanes sp.]